MTILKQVDVRGVQRGVHKVHGAVVQFDQDGYEIAVRVSSWVDKESMEAGQPAESWLLAPLRDLQLAPAPVIEQFLIDSDEKFSGGVLESLDPVQNSLQVVQAKKIDEINRIWYEHLDGGFTHAGYTWQSDPISRNNIAGMAAAVGNNYQLDPGFYWTTADNINVPMDNEAFKQLGFALTTHIVRLQAIARDLKNQVLAMTTVEEIQAVTWPTEPEPAT